MLSKDVRNNNKLVFLQAISLCFLPEEKRDTELLGALEVELPEDGDMAEVITDLMYAFQAFFNQVTESEIDPLEFLAVLTRLLFQDKLALASEKGNDDA